MNLDILITTSNDRIYNIKNLLLDPQENIRYIISHQIFDGNKYQFKSDRKDILYKKTETKGLSKNRNITLSLASADICLIADDDVKYTKEWLNNIFKAFKENPVADIITFKVKTNATEPSLRNYPNFTYWHDIRTIFQVSSIEIAFRLKSVKGINIKFDENFGLGAQFNSGEEHIFLIDALIKGLKIKFVPYYIVNHPYSFSSKMSSERMIKTLGALFYRMFGFLCIFFVIYSAFYNYKEYRYHISILKYIKLAFQGSYLVYKNYNSRKNLLTFSVFKVFIRFLRSLNFKKISLRKDQYGKKIF